MAKHKFENGVNPLDEIKDKILKRDIPGARYLEINRILIKSQVRKTFDEESIRELADSIKEIGLINPLTVKEDDDGNFLLIAGERRYKALKLLGETKVKVIISDIQEENIELIQLIENLHRENLPPLELAAGYKLLRDKYNLSARDIAKKIGKSHTHVYDTLNLLDLENDLKEKVSSNLTPSKALEINKLDKKTQKEVLKNIDNYSGNDIKKIRKEKELKEKVSSNLTPSKANKYSTFDLKTENSEQNQEFEKDENFSGRPTLEPEDPDELTETPDTENQIPGAPPYEQMRNQMPGETSKAVIDDFYGKAPNTENQGVEETENLNQEQEDQIPGLDEIIKEFNSLMKNIQIKNIGFQAISIWASEEQTLKNIIGSLQVIFGKGKNDGNGKRRN